ncbi:hypothetical protein DFH08DRAFT_965010 [Mycena albidolilacea]|uniref:Uncharacterized protein n=1 Tax=Mycena albidolilacea TaxID=1033008 RepID=A0AAD6ZRN3_9AGAR|nr:hypothetical protein DFH08DRAFT_965010 [Mycena albidolilacea]
MFDPNFSPFNGVPPLPHTQPSTAAASFPGIQYDPSGRPWFCDNNGKWAPSLHFICYQQSALPSHPGTADQVGAQSYNFRPGFTSSTGPARTSVSNNAYPALIDLALLPQPLDEDRPDPATIARSRGLKPATDQVDSDAAPPPTKQRGRLKGLSNFVSWDVNKLLDIAEKVCPMGQKGWKKVTKQYNKFARKYHRPERDEKSLESNWYVLKQQLLNLEL